MNTKQFTHSVRTLSIALMVAVLVLAPLPDRRAYAAGVVGTGTPESCTETALNAALTGGGLVTFNCGGAKTITITSTKTISNDTIIQDEDLITISGGNSVRIFKVNSGVTLTLQDITVANGNAYDAAGVLNQGGTVNIIHSNFTGNNADCTGSAVTCYPYGGAIYNQNNGVLNITDSTFFNNSGGPELYPAKGGAIYNADSAINITHSLFSDNTSQEGGAIYNYSGNIQVTGVSTFTENLATNSSIVNYPYGGAIYNAGLLTIDQTTFNGNHASSTGGSYGFGGAIYSNHQLSVSDSNFLNNYAASVGGIGGAIWVSGQSKITGSDFSANYLNGANTYGGAIYFRSGTHSIESCTFSGRGGGLKSADYGGAIANDESELTITDSEFTENKANDGGGVYSKYPGTLTISHSTFDHNEANSGGGLATSSDNTSVTECTFEDNNALNSGDAFGGGIYNGGTMTVTLTSFIENEAWTSSTSDAQGGGIYSWSDRLIIGESAFHGNITYSDEGMSAGSAIYAGQAMTITGSVFFHNGYVGNGTVHLDSGDYSIDNSTFYSNTVSAQGSAVYKSTLANLVLLHNTIAQNEGIALYSEFTTNPMTMTNSIVANNQKNCEGQIINGGGNLQYGGSVSNSCGSFNESNPMLDTLQDYGGPTLTMRLEGGSPARDNATANCPAYDQRGFTRSTAPCDSGAYEVGGTGVSLSSSANPSFPWKQVTFTATVEESDASTPTGTIIFKDNGVVLDTITVDGSGKATYTTTWRENGDHPITAEYSGDSNFQPSQSSILEQVVNGFVVFLPLVSRN